MLPSSIGWLPSNTFRTCRLSDRATATGGGDGFAGAATGTREGATGLDCTRLFL
jgi:hypothetical protein